MESGRPARASGLSSSLRDHAALGESPRAICLESLLCSAETLELVVEMIKSENYKLAHLAASILWALAPAASTRSITTALGAVKLLLDLLKRTLDVRSWRHCRHHLIRS